MGFGGPVWHTSIAARYPLIVNREATLFRLAMEQLEGVGDPSLGEWRETGDIAVHLRRRLTSDEIAASTIHEVCDIRGTPEYTQRIQQIKPFLPAPMQNLSPTAYP